MSAKEKLQSVTMSQIPMVGPKDEHDSHLGTQKQNVKPEQTQTHDIRISGRLKSERETYLQRTHEIDDICPRKLLGLRLLLLWYMYGTSRTTQCAPWNQLWQQNHILLTKYHLSHRGGSKCNCHDDEGCSKAQKITGRVVVAVTVT